MTESSYWGQLTAIDLYDCPKELLTNKLHLKKFPKEVNHLINYTNKKLTI